MAALLTRCLSDLRHAGDVPTLGRVLDDFLSRRRLTDFVFYDPARPLAESASLRQFNESLVARFDAAQVWRYDPLRLQTRIQPLFWNADEPGTEPSRARELVWTPMAQAGYRHYIAVPIYGPMGRCDVLGVAAREARDPTRDAHHLVDELVPIAYNLARLIQARDLGEAAAISARELECLQWTARGKTAWEVGRILGISERTANFHLCNAMRKLNAPSKHQAAIKAMRLGVLPVDPPADPAGPEPA